jgi:hypothetical protein
VNATIADASGTGTITDDDARRRSRSPTSPSVEGNAGNTVMTFSVTLSAASGRRHRRLGDGAGHGDRGLRLHDRLGDADVRRGHDVADRHRQRARRHVLDEVNETFFVNLTNAVNGTLLDAQGQGTITDDDAAPSLDARRRRP